MAWCSSLTIFPYIWLSQAGHTLTGLFVVVSGEYLGVGLGAIALTAYMARETSRAFTATQFALFSSFIAVPRTFANASTGFIVEAVGWTQFYVVCALVAIPGMLLLLKVAPWRERTEPNEKPRFSVLPEAERQYRQPGHFQVLRGERQADDGDGEQAGQHQVNNGQFQPRQQNPDHVHDHRQRRRSAAVSRVFASKRRQPEHRQFEALDAERDADDGQAQNYPAQQVEQRKSGIRQVRTTGYSVIRFTLRSPRRPALHVVITVG